MNHFSPVTPLVSLLFLSFLIPSNVLEHYKLIHCKNDWVTLTQFGHLSCYCSMQLR